MFFPIFLFHFIEGSVRDGEHVRNLCRNEIKIEYLGENLSSFLPLVALNNNYSLPNDVQGGFAGAVVFVEDVKFVRGKGIFDEVHVQDDDFCAIEDVANNDIVLLIGVLVMVQGVLVFYFGIGQDLKVGGADGFEGQFQHFVAVASEQLGVAFLLFQGLHHSLVDPVCYGYQQKGQEDLQHYRIEGPIQL